MEQTKDKKQAQLVNVTSVTLFEAILGTELYAIGERPVYTIVSDMVSVPETEMIAFTNNIQKIIDGNADAADIAKTSPAFKCLGGLNRETQRQFLNSNRGTFVYTLPMFMSEHCYKALENSKSTDEYLFIHILLKENQTKDGYILNDVKLMRPNYQKDEYSDVYRECIRALSNVAGIEAACLMLLSHGEANGRVFNTCYQIEEAKILKTEGGFDFKTTGRMSKSLDSVNIDVPKKNRLVTKIFSLGFRTRDFRDITGNHSFLDVSEFGLVPKMEGGISVKEEKKLLSEVISSEMDPGSGSTADVKQEVSSAISDDGPEIKIEENTGVPKANKDKVEKPKDPVKKPIVKKDKAQSKTGSVVKLKDLTEKINQSDISTGKRVKFKDEILKNEEVAEMLFKVYRYYGKPATLIKKIEENNYFSSDVEVDEAIQCLLDVASNAGISFKSLLKAPIYGKAFGTYFTKRINEDVESCLPILAIGVQKWMGSGVKVFINSRVCLLMEHIASLPVLTDFVTAKTGKGGNMFSLLQRDYGNGDYTYGQLIKGALLSFPNFNKGDVLTVITQDTVKACLTTLKKIFPPKILTSEMAYVKGCIETLIVLKNNVNRFRAKSSKVKNEGMQSLSHMLGITSGVLRPQEDKPRRTTEKAILKPLEGDKSAQANKKNAVRVKKPEVNSKDAIIENNSQVLPEKEDKQHAETKIVEAVKFKPKFEPLVDIVALRRLNVATIEYNKVMTKVNSTKPEDLTEEIINELEKVSAALTEARKPFN